MTVGRFVYTPDWRQDLDRTFFALSSDGPIFETFLKSFSSLSQFVLGSVVNTRCLDFIFILFSVCRMITFETFENRTRFTIFHAYANAQKHCIIILYYCAVLLLI